MRVNDLTLLLHKLVYFQIYFNVFCLPALIQQSSLVQSLGDDRSNGLCQVWEVHSHSPAKGTSHQRVLEGPASYSFSTAQNWSCQRMKDNQMNNKASRKIIPFTGNGLQWVGLPEESVKLKNKLFCLHLVKCKIVTFGSSKGQYCITFLFYKYVMSNDLSDNI